MEMLLNTVRIIKYDQLRTLANETNDSLQEKLAIGLFNPEDMKKINLKENSKAKLSSQFGKVIVNVKQDKDIPNGIAVMPVSIWSNQITGIEDNNLFFKNIKVKVEPTQELVLSFKDILNSIKAN